MTQAPRVKICGVTRLEDARLAAELGAWALGMIFFPGSPRRASLSEAQRISNELRRRVELAGVFVNAALEEVLEHAELLGLSLVQLHGDEGPAFCSEVARRTGARVIKAHSLAGPGDLRDLERFHTDFHLADTPAPGMFGGTGRTFDWSVLAQRTSRLPLILSGGLEPGNVARAIAATGPYAVDTASGVEASPGRKDPAKLEAFFAAVAGTADPPAQPSEAPPALLTDALAG